MKKIILCITALLVLSSIEAKKPTTEQLRAKISEKDETIKMLRDSLALPDTLCVTVRDSIFCFATSEGQDIATPIVDYIEEQNNKGWPKTLGGWIAVIIGFIPLVLGTKKLAAINSVWNVLKPYLKTRLGLAVIAGGALSAIATFIVSMGRFDFNIFLSIWPWAALGASYLHNIVSKKEDVVQKG